MKKQIESVCRIKIRRKRICLGVIDEDNPCDFYEKKTNTNNICRYYGSGWLCPNRKAYPKDIDPKYFL